MEEFLDSSKKIIGDARHRSIYHHTEGVWLCQRIFGRVLTIQRQHGTVDVPVRLVAERHIIEDIGWLPSPFAYIENMSLAMWMSGSERKEYPLNTLLGAQ